MAKELPYFKFEPSEWLEGEIQICSDKAQACFISLCAGYWIKTGCISYAFALHKYCRKDKDVMQELLDMRIISIEEDQIIIKFLDDQLDEWQETSQKRRNAANKRWSNASALQVQSKSNAIREDKIRKEEKKEEDIILYPSFSDFWELYDKKTDKQKCESKWKKLSQKEKEAILEYLPDYIKSTPEKKYRRNPVTFLNNRTWENEIIENGKQNSKKGLTSEQLDYLLDQGF